MDKRAEEIATEVANNHDRLESQYNPNLEDYILEALSTIEVEAYNKAISDCVSVSCDVMLECSDDKETRIHKIREYVTQAIKQLKRGE